MQEMIALALVALVVVIALTLRRRNRRRREATNQARRPQNEATVRFHRRRR